MRTTLSIDDGLLEEAKSRARQHNTSLGAVVNEALRLGLLRAEERSSKTLHLPLKTFAGNGLQPGVDLHHSAGLLEIMENS